MELSHTLCLVYDDNFSVNESPVNQCVEAITGRRAGHWWRVNILVLRMGKSFDLFESDGGYAGGFEAVGEVP